MTRTNNFKLDLNRMEKCRISCEICESEDTESIDEPCLSCTKNPFSDEVLALAQKTGKELFECEAIIQAEKNQS